MGHHSVDVDPILPNEVIQTSRMNPTASPVFNETGDFDSCLQDGRVGWLGLTSLPTIYPKGTHPSERGGHSRQILIRLWAESVLH